MLQPKVPYSVRSGRPVPQPWPAFEAIKGPPGELRWHRSVVRFPADVSATIEGEGGSSGVGGRMLAISGKAGTIRLDLQVGLGEALKLSGSHTVRPACCEDF